MLISGADTINRNRFIGWKNSLPRGWRISFDLKPTAILNGYSGILRMGTGGNINNYGDRSPAIFFAPKSTKLYICSAVNGKVNYCTTSTVSVPMYKVSKIVVQQVQDHRNNYNFEVFLNGQKIQSTYNSRPQIFIKVRITSSDPWHQSAKAEIENFELTTFKHRGIYLYNIPTVFNCMSKRRNVKKKCSAPPLIVLTFQQYFNSFI